MQSLTHSSSQFCRQPQAHKHYIFKINWFFKLYFFSTTFTSIRSAMLQHMKEQTRTRCICVTQYLLWNSTFPLYQCNFLCQTPAIFISIFTYYPHCPQFFHAIGILNSKCNFDSTPQSVLCVFWEKTLKRSTATEFFKLWKSENFCVQVNKVSYQTTKHTVFKLISSVHFYISVSEEHF